MILICKKILNQGIAFGTAFIFNENYFYNLNKKISINNIKKEIILFNKFYKKILIKLNKIKFKFNKIFKKKEINFIEISIKLLEKNFFVEKVSNIINKKLFNFTKSILIVLNFILKKYYNKNTDNKYYLYIKYISNFIVINLIYKVDFNSNYLNNNTVIIMKDLSLLYIIKFISLNINGLIIKSKNNKIYKNKYIKLLNIPVIFGIKNIQNFIKNGDYIGINTIDNKLYINPSSYNIRLLKNHNIPFI